LVEANGFSEKCLIEFEYRREKGVWKQVYLRIDWRIRKRLESELSRLIYIEPVKTPPEYWPYRLEGRLLELLGKARLDGGSVDKWQSGEYGQDGETYRVAIAVKERNDAAPHGPSLI
jgi:hypothetical protein